MRTRWSLVGSIALLGVLFVAGEATAQTTVSYGRITAVRQVDIQNQGAQTPPARSSAAPWASPRVPASRAATAHCAAWAAQRSAAAWQARPARPPGLSTPC